MEKELYFIMESSSMDVYSVEFYDNFEDAKQNAFEAVEDAPEYEYYIYKAQKIGTAVVPLKAQYIPED